MNLGGGRGGGTEPSEDVCLVGMAIEVLLETWDAGSDEAIGETLTKGL